MQERVGDLVDERTVTLIFSNSLVIAQRHAEFLAELELEGASSGGPPTIRTGGLRVFALTADSGLIFCRRCRTATVARVFLKYADDLKIYKTCVVSC